MIKIIVLILTIFTSIYQEAKAGCDVTTENVTQAFESDFFKPKFQYYCDNYNNSSKCMEKSYNSLHKLYSACFNYDDREAIIFNAFIYNTKGQPVGLNWMKIDMHTILKKLENGYKDIK